MRTYGRVYFEGDGVTPLEEPRWVVVETAPDGDNSAVMLLTLIQTLKLNLNESPFWGNYGLPAHPAVVQQVFPDYYVFLTQQRFAPFFASLIVAKQNSPTPTYRINVTTKQGAKLTQDVVT